MFKFYKVFFAIIISLFFFSFNTTIAKDTKPSRLSLAVGVPNIVGLNFEYVLPVLDSRFAASVFFTYLPASAFVKLDSNQSGSVVYWSVGANYYIFSPGKGLYLGVSYGNMSANSKQTGLNGYYTEEGGTGRTVPIVDGTATAKASMDMYFIKLGYRFIWGAFTLAPEVGYGHNNGTNGINYEISDANYKAVGQSFDFSIKAGSIPTFVLMLGIAF